MKRKGLGFGLVALMMAILGTGSEAQPPGKKDGPGFGDRKGPPNSLIRAVDDLGISDSQRRAVVAAVRDYEDDSRRLAEIGGAGLLLTRFFQLAREPLDLLLQVKF